MRKSLLALFAGIAVTSTVHADDWPQFRGPERSGVSKETGLLKEWPKDGPKLAWTFKNAGLGCSSVAVVKSVVYTLGTDYEPKMPNAPAFDPKKPMAGGLKEYVIAIEEKNGKELWRHEIGPLSTFAKPFNAYGDGPRSTPTIDGNFLYALGGNGQLVCIDIANKKEVWRKHLVMDLGGVMGKYGYSESLLIDGDKLICTPGGPQGTLAALDKSTGAVVWRSKGLTNLAHYSSMVAADIHGVRQYIQTSFVSKPGDIHGELSGVDTNGNLLWSEKIYTGENEGTAASPIVFGNQVYITVGWAQAATSSTSAPSRPRPTSTTRKNRRDSRTRTAASFSSMVTFTATPSVTVGSARIRKRVRSNGRKTASCGQGAGPSSPLRANSIFSPKKAKWAWQMLTPASSS